MTDDAVIASPLTVFGGVSNFRWSLLTQVVNEDARLGYYPDNQRDEL